MTPKEKAIEMVEKYKAIGIKVKWHDLMHVIHDNENAKLHAIVAVDEIIEVAYWKSVKDYWQQVKTEIEKL